MMIYVNYTVHGVKCQAGPYKTVEEADEHKRDISSFEGVTSCFISGLRDPARRLMSSNEAS